MKVYVLMTQWKDGGPGISGVFSSFGKAIAFFMRMEFKDATMPVAEMQSKVALTALKMAHRTTRTSRTSATRGRGSRSAKWTNSARPGSWRSGNDGR